MVISTELVSLKKENLAILYSLFTILTKYLEKLGIPHDQYSKIFLKK